MVHLTDHIRELLEASLYDGTPCLLGTATAGGAPQISPKGSVTVFDPQRLSYWERAFRSSIEHVKENPQVVVYYRNTKKIGEEFPGATLRFHGRARIAEDPALREQIWEKTIQGEKDRDPEKKGFGVLIDVERVELLSGQSVLEG